MSDQHSQNRDEFLAVCRDIADSESILTKLEDELRLQGFAGSTDLPKLVFLCLYTRFSDKLVSLVIKGPSGSGKSFALHAGLQFVPPSAFEEFSGMSEKALVYSENLDLKNRYLVIGEAAGLSQGDGRAFLRQLLSEGVVKYVTVQKTSSGMTSKELKPIEGPTGLIMTTTANALHLEDESRMLSYHLDESIERVREALVSQAQSSQSQKRQLDTNAWFALHEYIGSGDWSVVVPFAEQLARKLPLSHFRVMRDFPQILSLIGAHALMHQCTRKRTQAGDVIAALDDYRAVYDLVSETLAQGLEEAVPDTIRTVVEKVRELENAASKEAFNAPGISQVHLADELGRDQSVISRHVRKAVGMGFLKDVTPGQGKKATLVIGDRELPKGSVLPKPEEIEEEEEMMLAA